MELRREEWDDPSELVPEQILPVQFAESLQRSAERTPELRLMAAVLEDAIRTFCRCSGSAGVRRRRLFRETADWFESPDVRWPCSFENICDALALEPVPSASPARADQTAIDRVDGATGNRSGAGTTSAGLIPSFCIFERSVVRLSPRRAAAPRGPATTPFV